MQLWHVCLCVYVYVCLCVVWLDGSGQYAVVEFHNRHLFHLFHLFLNG